MQPMLPANITPGIVNIPGRDPQAQAVAESLLEQDRERYHCLFDWKRGFHNHLSHRLLAAYDLGAPATLLRAMYDYDTQILKPIDDEAEHVELTPDNFTKYLGQDRYYQSFLTFFTERVKESGASETMENYVFSPAVNIDGVQMFTRFMSGLYHSFIQTGYGAEFGSDALIAQGLAQAAVHSAQCAEVVDVTTEDGSDTSIRDDQGGRPLFHILREFYDSDALKPVPYGADKSLVQYRQETMKDGRAEEIKRLCSTWWSNATLESQVLNLDGKIEELQWVLALLLCGTSKRGRKLRLDFVLVHALNASLFLPSLLKIIPTSASKVTLLRAFLSIAMMYFLARGRPRIDMGAVMSHPAAPRPPGQQGTCTPHADALGDVNETYNPWMNIVASVLHNPDLHAIKTIRVLYNAARNYGHKSARDLPGCFITTDKGQQEETIAGLPELDGTLFVRAAGTVMDTLGWVSHGDSPGKWDFSGIGWDEAWRESD